MENYAQGITPPLALAASVTCLVTFALLYGVFGRGMALLLALFKAGVPLLFFAFWDDGSWRATDDLAYVEEATQLLDSGMSPVDLLVDPSAKDILFSVAGGRHMGFHVLNLLGLMLFGVHYYSTVFLSVMLTAVAALGVWKLVRLATPDRSYAQGVTLWFAVSPALVSWSSFINLKDTLVLTLTVWMFAGLVSFLQDRRMRALVGVALVCFVMLFVRWYVVILFAGTAALWATLSLRGTKRLLLLGSGVLAALYAFRSGLPLQYINPADTLEGTVRFAFTPRPWGIQPSYSFLLLPSLVHWLLAPVAVWGGIRLWRSLPASRPVILYSLVLLLFFGMVSELQGPRHRLQCLLAFSWMQFHGMYVILREMLARRLGPLAQAPAS